MGKIGDVYYVVSLDAKGIPQLAKKEGEKAGDTFGKGMKAKIGSAFKGGKGDILGMVGLGAGLGVAAVGLSKVIGFLGESVQAASSLNEAVSKSQAVFKDSSAEVEAWAETASTAFGQSKRQALEAAGTFGNLLQAFGIGTDKATEMSKSMVQLASDLASFNNTSVDDAIEALRSGLSGETEPLKRYGIAISDARMRTELMAQGVDKLGATLTPLQKTQAAYALILKDSTLAQGDFTRTAGGLANMQKTLTARMEDVSAELGTKLLPSMIALSDWAINEGVPALETTIDVLTGIVKAAIELDAGVTKLTDDLLSYTDAQGKAAEGTDFLGDNVTPLGRAIHGLADDITWLVNQEQDLLDGGHRVADLMRAQEAAAKRTGGSMTGVGTHAGKMADDVVTAAEDVTTASGDMATAIKADNKVVETSWDELRKKLKDDVDSLIDSAFEPIITQNQLAASNAEASAARRIIASGKAKDAEKRDASDTLDSVVKDQAGYLTTLAAAGQTGSKAYKTGLASLKAYAKTTSGDTRKELDLVIAKIEQVEREGKSVPINIQVNRKGNIGTDGGRATGGPVIAGHIYKVNENTPNTELWSPDVSGRVLSGAVPATASAATGPTYHVTVNNPEPRAAEPDISRTLRRMAALG